MFKVNGYDINDTSVGFGTYSIAIRLNCIDKVINGITVTELESLDLYVYREHDVYIVVASNPTIPTFFNSLRNNNVFVRPDTDTLAGIDFIATETYQNSYLNLNSAIFFDVNGFIETVDDSLSEDGDGYVSMREIIQYYESLGIEIYDRLTGYIFNEYNLENYGFKLSKNTILQTRLKEV